MDSLDACTKKELLIIAKKYRISYAQKYKKQDLITKIQEVQKSSIKTIQPIVINNNHYTTIIHISDIHIRPLTRHEEFEKVFEKLYSFLENTKEYNQHRIIAITGDLLQEKDNLKPETLLVCRTFLKKCSLYGTVIVIAGNHDMLENNTNRLDNITAIVDDIPIHYCIDSGSYQFGNTVITVSSLVDKKFIQSHQVETNNLTHICLYHGSIIGSTTDIGHTIQEMEGTTRFRNISEFDGFDMVLLGDIHKYQKIKSHIAYSGSLIQQNFGESLENHGFLEWNIQEKTSVFHSIPNTYGFVTIPCNHTEYTIPENIPKNPYIRILSTNADITTIETIKQELSSYNIQSFSVKEQFLVEQVEYKEDMVFHQDDIQMIEQEIQEYTDIEKESIFSIHSSIKEKVQTEMSFQMNHCQWEIQILHFKNVFIYGNNELRTIDFKNMLGIIGIIGPNASGKTSIINIILFLLYGNTGNKIIHVLNKKEKEYYIEGEFLFGTTKYKIIRSGCIRKGNKLNHTLSVFIWKNTWIKQDLENNTKTNQYIQEKIGTYDNFLLTNMYSNSSLRSILQYTNSEKYKALRSLFAIDMYEYYEKEAKKIIQNYTTRKQEIEATIQGLEYTIPTIQNIEDLYKKEEEYREIIQKIEKQKQHIEKSYSQIENTIDICKNNIVECEIIDFDSVKTSLQKYYLELENTEESNHTIEELQKELYHIEKIYTIVEKPTDIEENSLQELRELQKKHIDTLTIYSKKYTEFQETIQYIQQKQLEIQKKIIPTQNCIDYSVEIQSYEPIQEITYTEKEISYLSNCLYNYQKDTISKITHKKLPDDFDFVKNTKKLEKMKYQIEEIEKNIFYTKKISPVENNTIFTNCSTIEEIEELYKKTYIQYKKEQKEIRENVCMIRLEDIPVMKYIENIIQQEKSTNIIPLLQKLPSKIIDSLDSCIQYKEYCEKENIQEHNTKIQNNIQELEHMYNCACYTYYSHKHTLYSKKYKKYKAYQDTFLYNSYQRYEEIQKYKKYTELCKKQQEFESYTSIQKEQEYYTKEQETLEQEYKTLILQIQNIEQKRKDIEYNLEHTTKKIEHLQQYKEFIKNKRMIEKIQKQIQTQEIRNSCISLEEIIAKKDSYTKIYNTNKDLEKNIKEFQETLEKYNKELSELETKYTMYKQYHIEISCSIKHTLEEKKKQTDIKNKIQELYEEKKDIEDDIEMYTKYMILVSKNNIPKKCIHTKISYIEEYMNYCLSSIVDFRISIQIEKNNIQFIAHKDNLELDIEQLSGYETFITHIACKAALQKYSFISKSTLFIIDEGLDVVDRHNITRLEKLLQLLKCTFQHILVITHYSDITAMFDSIF